MKRSILFVALTAIGATSAMAQSNVSLSGRVNVTVESQKTDAGTSTLVVDNGSRLQFRGTEDLGGGLKASFLLDHRFSADTGQANPQFWAGESWVGVGGGFGTVRLGYMGATAAYLATADYISYHNHDTGTSADAFYIGQGSTTNMIAYTSPSIGGLVVEAQLGLKESGTKNTMILAANYDAGPLHLGAGYINGTSANVNINPLTPAVTGTEAKQVALRAAYDLGPITVGAYYAHDDISGTGFTWERDIYRVSAMYTIGAVELHANLGVAGEADTTGAAPGASVRRDAKQFTLGYNYNLSKRTKAYAFYTQLSGDGRTDYTALKSSIAAGIRHNF